MANSENNRTIRFPKVLWDLIDEDAKRCKRSSAQQIEMILSIYYGSEEHESKIDSKRISKMQGYSTETNNGNIKESLLKSINFSKRKSKNEGLVNEEAIIYQGKALYTQEQAPDDEKDKVK
jgi:hypothetical protein